MVFHREAVGGQRLDQGRLVGSDHVFDGVGAGLEPKKSLKAWLTILDSDCPNDYASC